MNTGRLDIPEAGGGWPRPPATAVADPAWRRQQRRRFRWVIWILGLALISLAGAVAISLLGSAPGQPGDVPLITADPRPVRIRPEDPGGLRLPDTEKGIYDQIAPGAARRPDQGQRVERLLPPPEAPKPVPAAPSLAPQRAALTEGPTPAQEARQPEQPAPPAAPPPPRPSQQGTAPSQPPPLAAAGTPQGSAPHGTAPHGTAPHGTAAVPSGTGRIQVQLAAVPSEAAAAAEWERLRRRMPDLLGNQRLSISRGEREGQPFWRVRTGAFEDNAQARAFCEQVRARGGSCFVAPAG